MRIVSLLPSTTEILFALGAGDDIVGVTFECDFPPEARTRRVVSTSALRPGLTPAATDQKVRTRIAAVDTGSHLHVKVEEQCYVIDGEMELRAGDELVVGRPVRSGPRGQPGPGRLPRRRRLPRHPDGTPSPSPAASRRHPR